jgi:hypothetical protein
MTKLYVDSKEVLIGSEVPADANEATPGYQQTEEVERLMKVLLKQPELLGELRKLLSLARDSGYLYGTWDTLNDLHREKQRNRCPHCNGPCRHGGD